MPLSLAVVALLTVAPAFDPPSSRPPTGASDRDGPPPAEPVETSEPDHGRPLVGFDLGGGLGAGGGTSGAVYALKLRFGWQFNHLLAASLQGSLLHWDSSPKTSADGSHSAHGQIGFQVTPLVTLTPRNVFELAAGPSLDGLLTTSSSSTSSGATSSRRTAGGDAVSYSSIYPGAHGRIAVHLFPEHSAETGRRSSFTLSADLHTTFAEGAALAFATAGVGVDLY